MNSKLGVTDLKAFVPSKDYEASRRFYEDMGFEEVWTSADVSHFRLGTFGFLLQKFYSKEMADNFMLSLMVADLDSWWEHLSNKNMEKNYPGVKLKAPHDTAWGLREIHLIDPAGVLWHIAQNPEG